MTDLKLDHDGRTPTMSTKISQVLDNQFAKKKKTVLSNVHQLFYISQPARKLHQIHSGLDLQFMLLFKKKWKELDYEVKQCLQTDRSLL